MGVVIHLHPAAVKRAQKGAAAKAAYEGEPVDHFAALQAQFEAPRHTNDPVGQFRVNQAEIGRYFAECHCGRCPFVHAYPSDASDAVAAALEDLKPVMSRVRKSLKQHTTSVARPSFANGDMQCRSGKTERRENRITEKFGQ